MASHSILRRTFTYGLPYGILMALFWKFAMPLFGDPNYGWVPALLMALFAGLMYGLMMAIWENKRWKKLSMMPMPDFGEETIVRKTPALYKRKQGWLVLSESMLFFQEAASGARLISIPVHEIQSVSFTSGVGFGYVIEVESSNPKKQKFLVENEEEWKGVLEGTSTAVST